MPYDSLIFDLDGTLWDTCESCAVAWNAVLAQQGIPFRTIVADDVRRVTGRPHAECIRAVFQGLPEPQVDVLIRETMTADNAAIEELGGLLYPGVDAGLRSLAKRYSLFIVSNCQAGYIDVFLRWSKLGDVFKDTECWGNTGHSKGANTASLIQRNHLRAPLLVGDTECDRQAARECGIPFVYAAYGFGQCAEPDFTIRSFPDLVDRLLPDRSDSGSPAAAG